MITLLNNKQQMPNLAQDEIVDALQSFSTKFKTDLLFQFIHLPFLTGKQFSTDQPIS